MIRGVPNWVWFLIIPGVMLAAWLLVARIAKNTPTERPYTAEDVEATKTSAKPIIAAIEKYLAVKGHPPWTLKGLAPEFLDAVPDPAAPFQYWIYDVTDDRTSYVLGFSAAIKHDHAWWYHGQTQAWTESTP